MTPHTETQEGYGVLVTRKDGTKYLATSWGSKIMSIRDSKYIKGRLAADGQTAKRFKIRATWEVIE